MNQTGSDLRIGTDASENSILDFEIFNHTIFTNICTTKMHSVLFIKQAFYKQK